jgi:hypothetical protein
VDMKCLSLCWRCRRLARAASSRTEGPPPELKSRPEETVPLTLSHTHQRPDHIEAVPGAAILSWLVLKCVEKNRRTRQVQPLLAAAAGTKTSADWRIRFITENVVCGAPNADSILAAFEGQAFPNSHACLQLLRGAHDVCLMEDTAQNKVETRCRQCGTVPETGRLFCANCGAHFERQLHWFLRVLKLLVACRSVR